MYLDLDLDLDLTCVSADHEAGSGPVSLLKLRSSILSPVSVDHDAGSGPETWSWLSRM